MYRKFGKRFLDILISLMLLLLFAPIILILILSLSLFHWGNPFFRQVRPGKDGQLFTLIKFKTMLDAYDEEGKLLDDHLRLKGFGSFVRKTSLDELPQLWNVLKGDMSLVGPRPLLVEYLALYNEEQARRHEVRPGITGWAQVNGRNQLSWEEKFRLDVWYVDHFSFILDIKILFLTVLKVFKSEGISSQGHVSMPRFEGNK